MKAMARQFSSSSLSSNSTPGNNNNDSSKSVDATYKIILLGDSGVGKSNLLLRFSKNQYCESTKPTVGVEFATKLVQIEDNKLVRAQIWDTAGQERYRLIASTYYRRAAGALLVYDVTNRKSFENVDKWLGEVRDIVGEDCLVMMIGNKIDLNSNEQTDAGAENSVVVTTEEGKDYALKNKIAFIETSAKEGKGVSSAFQHLLHAIYNVDSNRQRMALQQGKEKRQHNNWTNINTPSFDLRNSEDNRSVSSRGSQKKGCCHLGG